MSSASTDSVEPMRRRSVELSGFAHTNPIPPAAVIGPFLFSSGFVGRDPRSAALPPGLDDQIQNIFRHVRALMTRVGGSPDDIARMTFWLADFRERDALNREWVELFPDPASRPARQVIKAEFDGGVLVQADLIAVMVSAASALP